MIKVPKDPVPGGSCSSCLIESRRLAMLSHGEERTLVSLPLLAGHQPYYISPYDLIQPSLHSYRPCLKIQPHCGWDFNIGIWGEWDTECSPQQKLNSSLLKNSI